MSMACFIPKSREIQSPLKARASNLSWSQAFSSRAGGRAFRGLHRDQSSLREAKRCCRYPKEHFRHHLCNPADNYTNPPTNNQRRLYPAPAIILGAKDFTGIYIYKHFVIDIYTGLAVLAAVYIDLYVYGCRMYTCVRVHISEYLFKYTHTCWLYT